MFFNFPELLFRIARIRVPNEATRKVLLAVYVAADGCEEPFVCLSLRELSIASGGTPRPVLNKALKWLDKEGFVSRERSCPNIYYVNWQKLDLVSIPLPVLPDTYVAHA